MPAFLARAAPPLLGNVITRRLMCSRAKRACHCRAFTEVSSPEPSSTTITSIGMSVRWARSEARHASIVFDALNAGTTQVTPVTFVAAASAAIAEGCSATAVSGPGPRFERGVLACYLSRNICTTACASAKLSRPAAGARS